MTNPITHLQEAQNLTADAEVELFTVSLVTVPVVLRFKNNETVTWQGNVYEGMGCQLMGDKRSAGEEEGRPVLRMMNPEGVFNSFALAGMLDQAIVTKKTILRTHIDGNVNIYAQRMWYIERVKELVSGQVIGVELRSMTDLPNVQIPVRMYLPPEFPLVSL